MAIAGLLERFGDAGLTEGNCWGGWGGCRRDVGGGRSWSCVGVLPGPMTELAGALPCAMNRVYGAATVAAVWGGGLAGADHGVSARGGWERVADGGDGGAAERSGH